MEKYTIYANESWCNNKSNTERVRCLSHDTLSFYHEDYIGGKGYHNERGRIENLICTLKNDITPYPDAILTDAIKRLASILFMDLPEILKQSGISSLRVCVIPRAKHEEYYTAKQKLFRSTIQFVVNQVSGLSDGTSDITRHTDTQTTHLARRGNGGLGSLPYAGITLDTCAISDNVKGQNILLIDDLYTKTVNIDEDCIQALYEKGAKNVLFYSIGKTVRSF